LIKAIKFVASNQGMLQGPNGAAQELRALQHIKSLRHSFLLSIERVELIGGELIIVTELADRSLHDLLQDHRSAGQPGIPRHEALGFLLEAAEVLDFINQEHGLQHLDIKPRNLFLVGRHVKVADFGLVASLQEVMDKSDLLGGITPLYASPEIFSGKATMFSDQYSLAVTYHELLTGEAPYKAKNYAQLAMLVSTGTPDLSRLVEGDQICVARALSKDPNSRYPTCTAFIEEMFSATPTSAPSGMFNRPRTTSFEINLGDLSTTKQIKHTANSGVIRRPSKVVQTLPPAPAPTDEVLPGYRLQECVSQGPTGDLWRAFNPTNDPCLVRFLVEPDPHGPAAGAIARLLSITHDHVASLEVEQVGQNRVALISEAGDTNLATRLRECKASNQQGIPRLELISHLSYYAQALDELYHAQEIQHLILSPRLLALAQNEPILLEFGLAELLWMPQGIQPASLNQRYAAAELFEGLVSDACDQYSMALMYQEFLVGIHPYRNLNMRQMASPRLRGQPDVSFLPSSDRSILLKALHPDAAQRFRSCRDFILALEEGSYQAEHNAVRAPVSGQYPTVPPKPQSRVIPHAGHQQPQGYPGSGQYPTPSYPPSGQHPVPNYPASGQHPVPNYPASGQHPIQPQVRQPVASPTQEWMQGVEELMHLSAKGSEIITNGNTHFRNTSGQCIEMRAWSRLAQGMVKLKLSSFKEEWNAEWISSTQNRWVMEIRTQASIWQKAFGKSPGLLIEVVFGAVRETNLTPVRVAIFPNDGKGKPSQQLVEMAPGLLASVVSHLGLQCARSDQERYPTQLPAMIELGRTSYSGNLRDIGRDGVTMVSPTALQPGPGRVSFNRPGTPMTLQIPCQLRSCTPDDQGKFEIDVTFVR
jgi:serine/threonine protein kinase